MCLAPQKLVRTIFAWFFSSPLQVVLFCLIGIICNVQTRSINQPFDWFVMIRICKWDIIIVCVVATKTGKRFLAFTMNLLLFNQLILCVPVAFLMPFWFVPKSCHMVVYSVHCTSAWAWAQAHAFMESECVKLDYINFLWNRILFHASHESLMFPSR